LPLKRCLRAFALTRDIQMELQRGLVDYWAQHLSIPADRVARRSCSEEASNLSVRSCPGRFDLPARAGETISGRNGAVALSALGEPVSVWPS
jgi:hypothetical protein